MKKVKKPEFYFETGVAECILYNEDGHIFKGMAKCHPEDEDMMSEKVGCEIAQSRATIKALKYQKNCVIKPSIKALKQLYYSMRQSKKFNPKSYENIMLKRQIENWEWDLNLIEDMIDAEKTYLQNYIKDKEQMYQFIRKQRKGQN